MGRTPTAAVGSARSAAPSPTSHGELSRNYGCETSVSKSNAHWAGLYPATPSRVTCIEAQADLTPPLSVLDTAATDWHIAAR